MRRRGRREWNLDAKTSAPPRHAAHRPPSAALLDPPPPAARRRRGRREWNLDAKTSAPPRHVAHRPSSAELLDQLPHDTQTQASPGWRAPSICEPNERLPDPITIAGRNTRPFVVDAQTHQPRAAARRRGIDVQCDRHGLAVGAELQCVLDEVDHDLSHGRRVAPGASYAHRAVHHTAGDDDACRACMRLRLDETDGVAPHRAEIRPLWSRADSAPLAARVQQYLLG